MSMPGIDENWWASVLAEEGRELPRFDVRSRAVQKPGRSRGAVAEQQTGPDWARLKEIFLKDEIVSLTVRGHNRGGLLVGGDGLSGFVPLSHLVELGRGPDQTARTGVLESYVGRTLKLKVIECVPEERRVVFSERAALAQPGRRSALFTELRAGQIVTGTVTNTTDFGVFVDLGGLEGLIHISELSWGRVLDPAETVQLGQRIDVKVVELAPERSRVALSLKRLLPNPWEKAISEFPVGTILPATVTTVLSYGAFARLEAGVEGLIHVSEMAVPSGKTARQFLSPGQAVQVRVLHLDTQHQRLGLSLRLESGEV